MLRDMSDLENETQKRKYINEVLKKDDENYEEYETQREKRSKERLDRKKRREIIKRAIAVVVALGVAVAAGAYAKDKLSSTDKYDKEGNANNNEKTYEEYIDYVNEQNASGIPIEITEEGYKAYVDTQSQSKGSR